MFNWNDLRFFIGVAETGSLSGAARALQVDHATVGRRLAALEDSLGTKLVDRQAHRCIVTEAGHLVLTQAREVQELALSMERVLDHAHQGLTGTVTVSVPPVLVKNLLVASVAKLRAEFPNIRLALLGEAASVSLSKRQADIALRLSRPTERDTVVRKLGEMRFGLYASAAYLAGRNSTDLEFIASTEKCADKPHEQWLRKCAAGRPIAFENDDLSTHLEAARSRVGVAALPCFIADPVPELERVTPEHFIVREIWLLTHCDARRSPAVRTVIQFLSEQVQSHSHLGGGTFDSGRPSEEPLHGPRVGARCGRSADSDATVGALPG